MLPRILRVGLLAVATVIAAGCGSSTATTDPTRVTVATTAAPVTAATVTVTPSTAAPTTAVPTTAATTTTTTKPYVPATPQTAPDAASILLIEAWSAGSRTQAEAVAAPSAVASLFAAPYPGESLQARGCSAAFSPVTCVYRDGNSLIQVNVTQVPAGWWYVSSVVVEN